MLGVRKTTKFSLFAQYSEFESGKQTLAAFYDWKKAFLSETRTLVENDWALLDELSESKDVVTFLIEVLNEDIQLCLLAYFSLK